MFIVTISQNASINTCINTSIPAPVVTCDLHNVINLIRKGFNIMIKEEGSDKWMDCCDGKIMTCEIDGSQTFPEITTLLKALED